jgi:LacI family transcriptional regulator
MGFDGMDIAKFYHPTITTIKQPQKEMAEKSVKLLLDLCTDKAQNQKMILETKLIQGASCGVATTRLRHSNDKGLWYSNDKG